MQETWVLFLGQENPLEYGVAMHTSILAWKIPWTEDPGGLQSMGSDMTEHLTLSFSSIHGPLTLSLVLATPSLELSFLIRKTELGKIGIMKTYFI